MCAYHEKKVDDGLPDGGGRRPLEVLVAVNLEQLKCKNKPSTGDKIIDRPCGIHGSVTTGGQNFF